MKYSIIIIIALIGCKNQPKLIETKEILLPNNIIELTEAQKKSISISTGTLQLKTISKTIKVNGNIEVPPQNLVSISIPFGGYLKSTHLLPGMAISKGQVIATIEDIQFIKIQQDYLTTKAKLVLAETEYNRQKELNESKASSDKTFQMAVAEFQTLKIAKSALSEQLNFLHINPSNLNAQNISKTIKIYAPFNGYVSKVNVNIGKYLTPSDILFEFINPNDIHLKLKVFEKDLTDLSIGQKIQAYTNNNPTQKHSCRIILISKDISADGTVEVHCHFDNYNNKLLSGMYMNADIELTSRSVLSLPVEAIVNFDNKNFVFVSNSKNLYEMIQVSIGKSENGFTEIINSNNISNKTIVYNGAYALLMSLKNKEE